MIVEVPRWSHAKLEISPDDALNPIKHDLNKDGSIRFIANTFPSHGYLWNYGALPQTWEDPLHTDSSTKCKGDGDPVDVIDIGSKIHQSGEIIQVKILGTLAMIDEGKTDWKVIGIDITDESATRLTDVSDIDVYMPGLIKMTHDWFKFYKIADGKPANMFAYNGRAKTKSFTVNVLQETHQQWCSLIASKKSDVAFCRTHTSDLSKLGSKCRIGAEAANEIVQGHEEFGEAEAIMDEKVFHWHHVPLL